MSALGGIVKIGRGAIKIGKGVHNGEPEEILKGTVKIFRGTLRVIGGVLTGDFANGDEVSQEAEEEY